MVQKEIIVQVGCEGGSLTIEGMHYGDIGWQFRKIRNEWALADDFLEGEENTDPTQFFEQSDYLDSLGQALKLFDKYPYWIDMYIMKVHPEFLEEVLSEVRSRGGESVEARWREAVDDKLKLNSTVTTTIVKHVALAEEEWRRFTADLALCVSDLSEDDFLIISAKTTNYFVQFAGQGRFGTRAEATSNAFVEPGKELSDKKCELLQQIGWNAPNPDPIDGSPNFFRDFPEHSSFEAIAGLGVDTLRRAFEVERPGKLQYKSFREGGVAIRFPTLRLKRELR